eukprot:10270461-Heterocapsa_arctica.AAC.1
MNDMDSIRAASRGHLRIMDDAAEAFDQKMFEMAGVAHDALVDRPAPRRYGRQPGQEHGQQGQEQLRSDRESEAVKRMIG